MYKSKGSLSPRLRVCVSRLVRTLPKDLQYFDRYCPFSVAAMVQHAVTIRLSRSAESRQWLVQDPTFARSLYDTLLAWGMDSRGARLRPFSQFQARLAALGQSKEISDLQSRNALYLQDAEVGTTADSIWRLVLRLDPVETNSVMVSGTKALHHVLPDVVPPVDREYTLKFLLPSMPTGHDYSSQRRSEQLAFRKVFAAFCEVAHRRREYIEGVVEDQSGRVHTFHTSALKVIDNAIVGARLQRDWK